MEKEEEEEEEGEEMCVSAGDPISVVCVDQTTGHIVAGAQNNLKYVHVSLVSSVVFSPSAGCIPETWSSCRSVEVTLTPSGHSFTFLTESRYIICKVHLLAHT